MTQPSQKQLFSYFLDLGKKDTVQDFHPETYAQNLEEALRGNYNWSPITLAIILYRSAKLLAALDVQHPDNADDMRAILADALPHWERLAIEKCPKNASEAARATAAKNNTQTHFDGYGIANIAYSLGRMGYTPSETFRSAMNTAIQHTAPYMIPQDVSNTLWAYATLGILPPENVWQNMQESVARTADQMNGQAVANTAWALSVFAAMTERPDQFRSAADVLFPQAHKCRQVQGAKQIADAALVFGRAALFPMPKQPETGSQFELDVRAAFNAAAFTDAPEHAYIQALNRPVDMAIRDTNDNLLLVEADGPTHFITHADGTRTPDGGTILQTYLLKKCVPNATIVRVCHSRALWDNDNRRDERPAALKAAFAKAHAKNGPLKQGHAYGIVETPDGALEVRTFNALRLAAA